MISEFMSAQHRHCDTLFSDFEAVAEQERWPEADRAFGEFRRATLAHLEAEETVLFPAFEEATGMARNQGPTGVMIMEHEQIRDLMEQIAQALAARNAERVLDLGDTMMITIGQHNMKEEQVLYAMCDQRLPHDVLEALRS